MMRGKASFLSKLYSKVPSFSSVEFSEKVEGSSPPSVFIGRHGYPRVSVGPLIASSRGDVSAFDLPEEWIVNNRDAADIISFRMQLIRGKQPFNIRDGADGKTAAQLQEIALAKNALDVDAQFSKKPVGRFVDEEVLPFGASAPLESVELGNGYFNPRLEKAYADTDLKARDAVVSLYEQGVVFSSIQKAFSTGSFGLGSKRKLVPTRWSITAVDTAIADHLLDDVKSFEPIEDFRVYEHESLNNKFVVMLFPSRWKYEWIESFFPSVFGEKLEIFSDSEPFEGKKEYSPVGGCYYSAKMAVAETLRREQRQAGVIILREAYPGYVPLGVWNVRENMRLALKGQPGSFDSFDTMLRSALSRLKLSLGTWFQHSSLLREEYLR